MKKKKDIPVRIKMVDLQRQYMKRKVAYDKAIHTALEGGSFIEGPEVKKFTRKLETFLQHPYVVTCANGTDALQLALMALDLKPGDEVIVPAFTYAAAAEAVALLGLTPVVVDVEEATFNLDISKVEEAVSDRTRAVIAVHLFGLCCDMEALMELANRLGLFVIEDTAQALGAVYDYPDGRQMWAGTIGHIGTTSFFPTKPLSCFGDGGALITQDETLAEKLRMLAHHGQRKKYKHEIVGCNSRLDTLQAAVLLTNIDHYYPDARKRREIAERYDQELAKTTWIVRPFLSEFVAHVHHQYTIRVTNGERDQLQAYLREQGFESIVYYPYTIDQQEAFRPLVRMVREPETAHRLTREVLSLPIYTGLTRAEQMEVIKAIKTYGKR